MNPQIKTTIKFISTVFLLAALAACSPSADDTASTSSTTTTATDDITSTDFPFAFEKVASNTWVMHGPLELPNPENKGFMNNPGVVKTSAGLVVIDPGSTVQIGQHVLAEIKKISPLPVVAVFNTHVHGDHWLANQAIKAAYPEAKIYGHAEMLVEIERGEGQRWVDIMYSMTDGASEGTIVVAPNIEVNNNDVIKIGDTQFKIHHYGTAHTKTDIMIHVVENSVMFLGDNVLALRIPMMTSGTFEGNILAITNILENDIKTFVPGHGLTGDRSMVKAYLEYLTLVLDAAQKTFRDYLDSSDVITITSQTTAAFKDWHGYDDLLGAHGAQAFSEVEAAEF